MAGFAAGAGTDAADDWHGGGGGSGFGRRRRVGASDGVSGGTGGHGLVEIEGATTSEYTAQNVTENERYRCCVYDDYDNSAFLDFQLVIPITLNYGEETEAVILGGKTYLSFVPSQTGEYVFYSKGDDDPYARLCGRF